MSHALARIVSPEVSWDEYLASANLALGRSLTRSLDAKNNTRVNLAYFFGTLSELRAEGSNPEKIDGPVLEHLWFSLLISCGLRHKDELRDLSDFSGIKLLFSKDQLEQLVFVASGTMAAWRKAISYALRRESALDVRVVFGKVYLWLSAEGLSALWGGRTELTDGTFILDDAGPARR